MSARVTIIMGIYNCSGTLAEAVESILKQTFTEWKLVICDDGSTDDTPIIAERYHATDPERIVFIQNRENKGLHYTLNQCLKYVNTEYVARMDGDDISLPDRLEKEIAFLDAHPEYSIVSCPIIYFDFGGDFMEGEGGWEPDMAEYAKGTPFCHAPSVVRKEAFTAVEGYSECEKRLRVEDWDLWIRMRDAGFIGYILEEPLYKMRDDRDAHNRRKMKYRINEARVTAMAVRTLKLNPFLYIFCLRPIIVGLLPRPIYRFFHRKKFRELYLK